MDTDEAPDRVESSSGQTSLRLAKSAYTKWINAHLRNSDCSEVTDLFHDLQDGSKLLKLIEIFTGKKLPMERGRTKNHHILNVMKALDFLQKEAKIDLVGINSGAIVDGNQTSTMGLVWKMILHFEISSMTDTSGSVQSPKAELLQWTQSLVNGYSGVNVTNFHTSWRDGMAFCALIHSQVPHLLEYDTCDPLSPVNNLEKAFSVAEKGLHVIRLLEPEDVTVPKPSEEAIMMYVSKLRQSFAIDNQTEEEKVPPSSSSSSSSQLLDQFNSLYSSLHMNIISRKQYVTSQRKELPSSSFSSSSISITEYKTVLQTMLQDFRALRTSEDTTIMSEMESLGKMGDELGKSQSIQILEELWLAAVNESNEYETLLLSQLVRPKDLEEEAPRHCPVSLSQYFQSVDGAIMVQVVSVLVIMGIAISKEVSSN